MIDKIQFNPIMVEGIVAGRKTETRRLVKFKFEPRYEVGETIYVGEKLYRNPIYGISFGGGENISHADWIWKSDALYPGCMPVEYARLFLRITDVKIEWLQNITDGGAIAEGVFPAEEGWTWDNKKFYDSPREAFIDLWDDIYGEDGSRCWFTDPAVFVYKFEVVDKPGLVAAAY